MFHMNQNLKVVLAVEPVDLRKSFNGLYAIASSELGEIPEKGALFIFANRTKTRIKVLCFDGTGRGKDVTQAGGAGFADGRGGSARSANAALVSAVIFLIFYQV